MNQKPFNLRTILSVTTGRLLTASKGPQNNGIGDMYELLAWMTGDSPFTHQLGRFADECKPWLLRWHPQLQQCTDDLPALDAKLAAGLGIEQWVATWELALGTTLVVQQIPRDDHDHRDPYDELVQTRGTDEGIIVVAIDQPIDL